MYCLQWYMIVLLLSLTNASECPEARGCNACERDGDKYVINCTTSAPNSRLEIRTERKEKKIEIQCYNSPNWTEFRLNMHKSISNISVITFVECDFPEREGLGDIIKKIVTNPVKELEFLAGDDFTLYPTRRTFTGLKDLEELQVSSQRLYVTGDLLHDLKNLQVLYLSDNNLGQLPPDFLNLPNLREIELTSNRIKVIEPTMFDKSMKLVLLNIWNNEIVEIKPNSFDKLEYLKTLDIHNNNLTSLPDNIFSKLPNLKDIYLSHNNFTGDSLSENLLRNNSLLQVVTLSENKQSLITLPSKFIANFKHLTIIEIKGSGLIRLPEDLLVGAVSLRNLDMERNYIETIPLGLFQDCINLSTLGLSVNELRDLPDGVFSSLNKLESLDLSKNHITMISENTFKGLSALKVLNLENNGLKTIQHGGLIPLSSLQIAQFSFNQLTLESNITQPDGNFGPLSVFHTCMKTIERLELAHNNITIIFGDWNLAPKLEYLDLSYNNLELLMTEDFQFHSNFIEVDLSSNKIVTINLEELRPSPIEYRNQRNVIVKINDNPIICDCYLYRVLLYREKKFNPIIYEELTLKMDNLKCQGPYKLNNTRLDELNSESFLCSLDEPEASNASCPDGCNCWVRRRNKGYIIDCSYLNMKTAPEVLQCPSTFHIELNLTGNSLTTMPSMTQPGYDAVELLYLSKNQITELPLSGLTENLRVLYLDSNNLTKLKSPVVDFLSNSMNLMTLTLHKNPWIGDCNAREFLSFVQMKMVDIPELKRVTFEGSDLPVFEMTPEELCPLFIGWVIGISIGIAALGLIVGCLAAFYYRYQHEVKVWLYARHWCLWFVSEDELDKDKLYDAFICYSHKDRDFVENTLIPKLENVPNSFTICYHERDWKGGQFIPEQIVHSVEESRRTVVVLSPDFLNSVWGKMEFRTAHGQALSEGRARVIVILYRDIGPTDKLDPELKAYLNMNTYIKWGDPWFWDKLNYALPHPEDLIKKRRKSTVYTIQQPIIQIGNNKGGLTDESHVTIGV